MGYKNYNITIKSLNKKIADLQELKNYIYDKNTKKVVKQKIKDLEKEVQILTR